MLTFEVKSKSKMDAFEHIPKRLSYSPDFTCAITVDSHTPSISPLWLALDVRKWVESAVQTGTGCCLGLTVIKGCQLTRKRAGLACSLSLFFFFTKIGQCAKANKGFSEWGEKHYCLLMAAGRTAIKSTATEVSWQLAALVIIASLGFIVILLFGFLNSFVKLLWAIKKR